MTIENPAWKPNIAACDEIAWHHAWFLLMDPGDMSHRPHPNEGSMLDQTRNVVKEALA